MRSRYDIIRPIYIKKYITWSILLMVTAILLTYVCVQIYNSHLNANAINIIVNFLICLIVAVFVLKKLPGINKIYIALIKYRNEINAIRDSVHKIYVSVPGRTKGASFKKHYDFKTKSIQDFERNLTVAMWLEQREVYVTAIIKSNSVLKVFATMGSKYSCRPTHKLTEVVNSAIKLRCDEIRMYHNHIGTSNKTKPSPADILSMKSHICINTTGIRYRCFIIYWNQILEYRILEYNERGEYQLIYCYNSIE